MAELVEMPFRMGIRAGPRNHVFNGVHIDWTIRVRWWCSLLSNYFDRLLLLLLLLLVWRQCRYHHWGELLKMICNGFSRNWCRSRF